MRDLREKQVLPSSEWQKWLIFGFFIFTKETTLPLFCLISSYSYDLYSRKEISDLIFWDSLIVSEGEDMRSVFMNRSKYIWLMSEYHRRFWKVILDRGLACEFIVNRVSSLSREYTMISSDDDDELISEWCCFWEVVMMSWMKEVESPECHDYFCASFRICMWRFGERHKV